jgi:hypothetical protein
MRRSAALLALLVPACATPGRNVIVEVAPAPAPGEARLVALEVGRLLSADADASRAAETWLSRLDAPGRDALSEHAARIPGERDPRWLHVLDENGLLAESVPDLAPGDELVYALWKAGRPEGSYAMKAQSRLLDLARRSPETLLGHLERGEPGAEVVAVALALAGERRAGRPLLQRYRAARSDAERRAAAEALGLLAGQGRRPRVRGSAADLEKDALVVERWLAEAPEEDGDA